MKHSKGFAVVELVVAVVVLAIIGVVAYMYLNQPGEEQSNQTTDNTPATYQSNQDLDEAADEVEDIDINAELDASLKDLDETAAEF